MENLINKLMIGVLAFAAFYMVWHLGRWYEFNAYKGLINSATMNQYLLKNCLGRGVK
jgi:hypothetical protein